jgi:hypothetical protein
LGSLVESAAGNKFSSFTLLRTCGVFAADREASLVVSPPFALITGDPKLAGLEFAEVAGVVVLELWGCPLSFSGPITLVVRIVVPEEVLGDADGPPRDGRLDRAMPVPPARCSTFL